MGSVKFLAILLGLLAIGFQDEALAARRSPRTRAFGSVVERLISFVDVIVVQIQEGIKSADVHLDVIQAEMNPALGQFFGEIRGGLKDDFNSVVSSLDSLEREIRDALATVRGSIQPCLNTLVANVDPIIDKAEGRIAAVARQVQTKNRATLDHLEGDLDAFFDSLNKTIDTALASALICVVPGSANAKDCISNMFTVFVGDLQTSFMSVDAVLNEAGNFIPALANEALAGLVPICMSTMGAIDPHLTTFGECVKKTRYRSLM